MDKIFFILLNISSPPEISKYAKTSSCSEWPDKIIKRIYLGESAKPQNHPTILDMSLTKSNRLLKLLTTSTHHLRLPHTTYDFHTPPTTSTHHLRLPHTTYDFHTPPTTSTHHPRLLSSRTTCPADVPHGLPHNTTYTPPTTCRHPLRLVDTSYDFYTHPTTSTHTLRLVHTPYDLYTHPYDLYTPPTTCTPPPTTCTHPLRPVHTPYDLYTPPTTSLGGK